MDRWVDGWIEGGGRLEARERVEGRDEWSPGWSGDSRAECL